MEEEELPDTLIQAIKQRIKAFDIMESDKKDVKLVRHVLGNILEVVYNDPALKSFKRLEDLEFKVYVSRKSSPDAFVYPDGTIIISSGMLHLIRYDENFIAAVLAHEIMHVIQGHFFEKIGKCLQMLLATVNSVICQMRRLMDLGPSISWRTK
ncbi:hypothetical protein BGX31_006502 [Mortierella sp. GBA43]|nr:hypothetical protein BGX31_006502 [Mortierella sp. GBA43]